LCVLCSQPAVVYLHDLLNQHRLEEREEWDQERTRRMMTTSLLVVGPIGYSLFVQYERLIPGEEHYNKRGRTVVTWQ